MTLPTIPVNYVENAASVLVLTGATATDADLTSATPTTANVTITNTNADSKDRLRVIPSGVYSVTESEILPMGVSIATYAGGTDQRRCSFRSQPIWLEFKQF